MSGVDEFGDLIVQAYRERLRARKEAEMEHDTQAARRVSIAMVTAARTGTPMSIATFVQAAQDEGITSSEKILRLSIRVAWFNAEIARAALEALDQVKPGSGDEFVQRMALEQQFTETNGEEDGQAR